MKLSVGKSKKEASQDAKKAVEELKAYQKKHKLNVDKDYSKDKVHGPVIKKLQERINVGHIKSAEGLKDKSDAKKAEKKLSKPEIHKKVTKASEPNTYDYPQVKGKPMSPDSKSKFRAKMRPLLKSGMDAKKASALVIEKYFTKDQSAIPGVKETPKKDVKNSKTKVKVEPGKKEELKKPIKINKIKIKSKRDED